MPFMLQKNVGMAFATMRASRTRSFLTMLGIIIAVASVTIIASIGNGIQASVAKQTNLYSKNVITIRPAPLSSGTNIGALAGASPRAALTSNDVSNIESLPTVGSAVPLAVVGSAARADHYFKGVVFAANSDLPQVLNQNLAFGAFYTSKEETNNVAVLGATAADTLFDQKVPLGRSFSIHGKQYIVSGVLERFATAPLSGGTNFNNAIFVSSGASDGLSTNGAPIYELLARVGNSSQLPNTDAVITRLLARAHTSKDDFQVLSPTELASDANATYDSLSTFIFAAACIMLLVSGIGIMNVMLVSVTERIHEIGIRKAVGATNKQILSQFVTEAATLSITGSFIGVVISFVAVWLLKVFSPLVPSFDYGIAAIACALSCSFGIIFGTLPAIKAARKDPIAALRSE